mmetsp:Transcript_17253/g.47182  ORF Transcript_17253/g.47182 Transcript_17253/m.47182 type:complete len:106 (-) Transcript_17253:22-339(-)
MANASCLGSSDSNDSLLIQLIALRDESVVSALSEEEEEVMDRDDNDTTLYWGNVVCDTKALTEVKDMATTKAHTEAHSLPILLSFMLLFRSFMLRNVVCLSWTCC